MVKELFATPGAGQESDIFAFASDVDADQRMEIDRMGAMLKELEQGAAVMRSVLHCRAARRCRCCAVDAGIAQERSRPRRRPNDPRVGLKPGFKDAGVAARNMELVVEHAEARRLLRSEDAGRPADAAPRRRRRRRPPAAAARTPATPAPATPRGTRGRSRRLRRPPARSGLNFANSDLAFSGNHVFIGNFNGFNTYDIENAEQAAAARLGRLPGRPGRRVGPRQPAVHVGRADARPHRLRHAGRRRRRSSTERFRGVRIFDITDINKPKQVAAVQTCRGSHTHTLVTDPKDKANIYIYGSGTGAVRSGEELAGCSGERSEGGSEHGALQHRRDPGAARRAREGARSSTGRASSPTRRPAPSPACGRAAITVPARSAPRRPTSATTSRSSRRSASRPAPARATASCSTSRIR